MECNCSPGFKCGLHIRDFLEAQVEQLQARLEKKTEQYEFVRKQLHTERRAVADLALARPSLSGVIEQTAIEVMAQLTRFVVREEMTPEVAARTAVRLARALRDELQIEEGR